MISAAKSKHTRKPVRKTLRSKRKQLRNQAHTVIADFNAGKDPAAALAKFQHSIHTLARDLKGQDTKSSRAAVSALVNLDTSLKKLQNSGQTTDGAEITATLASGLRDLSSAYRNAKRAGQDWPL